MLLDKRKEPIECSLLMQVDGREWKKQGDGSAQLGNIDSHSYILFVCDDGLEMCWRVEKEKTFAYNSGKKITFFCDIEQVHRALEFRCAESARDCWNLLQTEQRREAEVEMITEISSQNMVQTPKSNLSAMFQAFSLTQVEAMASALFTPQNIDSIIHMAQERPESISELVRTSAQIKSLKKTFEQIKRRLDDPEADEGDRREARQQMDRLIEAVKIISTRASPASLRTQQHHDLLRPRERQLAAGLRGPAARPLLGRHAQGLRAPRRQGLRLRRVLRHLRLAGRRGDPHQLQAALRPRAPDQQDRRRKTGPRADQHDQHQLHRHHRAHPDRPAVHQPLPPETQAKRLHCPQNLQRSLQRAQAAAHLHRFRASTLA